MRWGPYRDGGEATGRLTAYADAVYARPVGVMWVCGGQSAWLRRPAFNGAGDGVAMLVRCEISPPPPIRSTALESVQNVLAKAEAGVRAAAPVALRVVGVTPEAQQLIGKYVVAPVDHFLTQHPAVKDGIVVVADVAGVIAGVAAGFAIVTVGGTAVVIAAAAATVVAGFACAVLLYEDVQHLWYTSRGNEAGRIRLENRTDYQWIQAIAPWFTLPDLAMGGRTAVRELAEAGHFSGRVASRLGRAQARSAAASRELRETLAGGEAGMRDIRTAQAAAQKRAHDLQRMRALALGANRNLLLKRNGLVSTVGGVWGARQYVHEPPVLTERGYDKAKEQARATARNVYERAEQVVGAHRGRAARPGEAEHLLTPAHPGPEAARAHLSLTTMVCRRKQQ